MAKKQKKSKQAKAFAQSAGQRPSALNGGWQGVPFDAADIYGQHTQSWMPPLWSADTERGPFRNRVVSRARDLVRNDGWAAGTVTRVQDNAIGISLRPISKPDYRALAHMSGNSAFDATWAREFGQAVDALWRSWADDPLHFNDGERMLTFGQQMHLAFRHLIVDGDALGVLPWLEDRVCRGGARYATALQLVDPDRLSNPQMQMDLQNIRNGVEIDALGVPIAYHIRQAHEADWYSAAKSVQWDRIERETSWGRPRVVHMFEHHRASQHTGATGILTPVMQRLKMLIKYDGSELDAAIINAIFAGYIESPYDQDMVAEALEGGDDSLGAYQDGRIAFHQNRNINLNGSRLPILYPGEKINTVSASRPAGNFRDFESAVLRNIAIGAGLAPQQVSNDWSEFNYSSARGAMQEAWKTLGRRRDDFATGFAAPIRLAWLEECMEVDNLPMPRNAPEFIDARQAYARANWLGPGRGWIDPVAEKQGAILGMDAGLSTLEEECAENEGGDWIEKIDQRAEEVQAFKDRGLPIPDWGGYLPPEQAPRNQDKS
ncbi:phage portal protein [Acetobacter malorum]|uniref:phage portal protein n=1 Tax=Acetobacter malorum TaxID=178901 RepID=UPI00248DEB60|nr:phage portal protein [Acetobacter malorum]